MQHLTMVDMATVMATDMATDMDVVLVLVGLDTAAITGHTADTDTVVIMAQELEYHSVLDSARSEFSVDHISGIAFFR